MEEDDEEEEEGEEETKEGDGTVEVSFDSEKGLRMALMRTRLLRSSESWLTFKSRVSSETSFSTTSITSLICFSDSLASLLCLDFGEIEASGDCGLEGEEEEDEEDEEEGEEGGSSSESELRRKRGFAEAYFLRS